MLSISFFVVFWRLPAGKEEGVNGHTASNFCHRLLMFNMQPRLRARPVGKKRDHKRPVPDARDPILIMNDNKM